MPRKKNTTAFTQAFLPINLKASVIDSIFHGTGLKDRVMLFYKIIFNAYKRYSGSKQDYSEYVTIHGSLVDKLFGEHKSRSAIKLLTGNGLVEMKEKFYEKDNPNSYPRSFRIPYELLQVELSGGKLYKKVDITNKKAFNAYVKYKAAKLKQILDASNSDILKRLAHYSQDVYLDLSSHAARILIEEHKLDVEKNGFSYAEYLEMVNERDIEWFKRDYYGRVHFAWVSLDKRCHPLIRFKGYDGEFCREIDIANSQPFFSSVIEYIPMLFPELSDLIVDLDFTSSDWHHYQSICKKGEFYEHWVVQLRNFLGENWMENQIAEQQAKFCAKLERWEKKAAQGKKAKKPTLKNDLFKCKGDCRKAAKMLFYAVIFNTQSETSKVSECFKAWLPSVWGAFKEIKSRYTPHNPSVKNSPKGSYTNLAFLMQKIESLVVIDTCTANLLNSANSSNSGLTQIIPRHDSLMAPSSLITQVEIALTNAFIQNNLPLPTLKIK